MTILFYLKPGQEMPPSGQPLGHGWDTKKRKAWRKLMIEKRRYERLRKDEEELLIRLLMDEL